MSNDELRLPAESREALFMRADATLVFAEPRGPRSDAVAGSAMKLARVATAMLARAAWARCGTPSSRVRRHGHTCEATTPRSSPWRSIVT
jgi:hypothetical protein